MTDPKPIDALKALVEQINKRHDQEVDHRNGLYALIYKECADKLSTFIPALEQEQKLAVEAEREACAVALEDLAERHLQSVPVDLGLVHNLREYARAIRSRGSSDALKEALNKAYSDGYWECTEHANNGLHGDCTCSFCEMLRKLLAKAREEGREQGQKEMRDAFENRVHVDPVTDVERIVLCQKCGTPVVFAMKNAHEAVEEARKQGRLEVYEQVYAKPAGFGFRYWARKEHERIHAELKGGEHEADS